MLRLRCGVLTCFDDTTNWGKSFLQFRLIATRSTDRVLPYRVHKIYVVIDQFLSLFRHLFLNLIVILLPNLLVGLVRGVRAVSLIPVLPSLFRILDVEFNLTLLLTFL